MKKQGIHTIKVLETEEAEFSVHLPHLQSVGLKFRETFQGRVQEQLLSNPKDNKKNLLIRERVGIIRLENDEIKPVNEIMLVSESRTEEVSTEHGTFEDVISEFTIQKFGKRGLPQFRQEVSYILDQWSLPEIGLNFQIWPFFRGRPLPPFLEIVTPEEPQLDAVIKLLRLEGKERTKLGVEGIFKLYKQRTALQNGNPPILSK